MKEFKFRDGQIVRHKLSADKVLVIRRSPMASDRCIYICRLYGYRIEEIDQVELKEDI